ncbi:caspase a-like isoform X4 [Syngnathus typhle]|uniref:caspase a-like isoform X4 n=1 Tax=Syngnathus typhle TaxID=161592 RepID=UPI002A69B103|nr:caspase a-like isoform X4 [Syngnathus typhle]
MAGTLQADWWSTNLIPCEKSFWNSKKNDLKNRGLDRHGADVDERNMQRLLEDLGYEVVKHTNLTGQQMDKAVLDFSKHSKLKDTDSVFVVIMSHGKSGSILGVNWNKTQTAEKEDVFPIDNIYKHLNSANCRALIDKPKIIIIQACRGEEPGNVDLSSVGGSLSSDGASGSHFVHLEKDFGALLSSTPHTKSYRDNVKGSLLIQFFVGIVKTHACEKELDKLFTMIMGCFEGLTQYDEKQMPVKHRWSMTKPFYLFPGI